MQSTSAKQISERKAEIVERYGDWTAHNLHLGDDLYLYAEHEPTATPEEKENNLWASIDNPRSFWLTRPSLYNLLAYAGFTSVYECFNPPAIQVSDDRITLLAIKGEPQQVRSSPPVEGSNFKQWPEQSGAKANSTAQPSMLRRLARGLPGPVKSAIKKRIS